MEPTVVIDGITGTARIELFRRNSDSAWVTLDLSDLDLVAGYRWYEARPIGGHTSYAHASLPRRGSERGWVIMHRLITGASGPVHVDHKDGDGLNNHRSNLRIATPSQNRYNEQTRRGGTSQYKRVIWREDRQAWSARAMVGDKYRHIGLYETELDAAVAADLVAMDAHGEFAHLNFDREFITSYGIPQRRMRPELPHGRGKYARDRCRCDVCREGENAYGRARRARIREQGKAAPR